MPIVHLDDRALIRVTGEEAEHFLHGLVTTDIAGLPERVARPGALLTPQGKIMFDFLVFRVADGFALDCRAATAGDLAKRLKLYKLRAKAEISEPEQQLVSVEWEIDSGASSDDSIFDGRFSAPVRRRHGAAAIAASAPRSAFDALRIENGVAELGLDYAAQDAFPHDVNFDQTGGVSFRKGCYVGQEVVSRMQHRGTARKRVLIVAGSAPLEPGADLVAGGRVTGNLGTAAGNRALAIARLDRVKEAIDAGQALVAGGVAVTASLPPGVSYGWPDAATAGEE
jgi:folate-binding protein YgfZ